jgi:hypothetical protein
MGFRLYEAVYWRIKMEEERIEPPLALVVPFLVYSADTPGQIC